MWCQAELSHAVDKEPVLIGTAIIDARPNDVRCIAGPRAGSK